MFEISVPFVSYGKGFLKHSLRKTRYRDVLMPVILNRKILKNTKREVFFCFHIDFKKSVFYFNTSVEGLL